MPPDELEGEDIRQHRRARRLARAAVAALSLLQGGAVPVPPRWLCAALPLRLLRRNLVSGEDPGGRPGGGGRTDPNGRVFVYYIDISYWTLLSGGWFEPARRRLPAPNRSTPQRCAALRCAALRA